MFLGPGQDIYIFPGQNSNYALRCHLCQEKSCWDTERGNCSRFHVDIRKLSLETADDTQTVREQLDFL